MKRLLWPVILLAACDVEKKEVPKAAPGPLTVATARVVSKKLDKHLRLPGELVAFQDVAIHSKVQGFVEGIGVDRGSAVKKGDQLVRLVAPELKAQRAEAEVRLASDEATYRRLKDASATPGVVAGNDVEVAAKVVEADRARVKTCEEHESYLKIAAPFDGIVTERWAHEGSMVGPSTGPLLRLQQISELRLVVPVPESAVGGVDVGDTVTFTVPAYPGQAISGEVARLARSVDPRTRSMPVELKVSNADGRLAPGMYPEISWPVRRKQPTLFVPATAVASTMEKTFVIRIKGGAVEWVDVKLGASTPDGVEVFGALAEGDVVAARGTDELKPGTTVNTKDAK